jgi:hypothetical protein
MSLRWRAGAALIKGASMGIFGLWVLGTVVWHALRGTVPDWTTMGAVGLVALLANAVCLVLLTAWRSGDANMRSVWICSRNDVVANVAVLLAALGVFGTGHRLARPDRGGRHGRPRPAGGRRRLPAGRGRMAQRGASAGGSRAALACDQGSWRSG